MRLPPFQALIDEHRTPLWRYLVAAVGPHDAGDCFQETMISALRAYPTLTHAQNLKGWLFTIAHHKVIDSARANGHRPVLVADVPEPAAPLSGAGAIDGAAGALSDDALWQAVRSLPPKQRSAVVLRHVGDWAYADIATLLECSEAAARQNVKAGLDRLRQEVTR